MRTRKIADNNIIPLSIINEGSGKSFLCLVKKKKIVNLLWYTSKSFKYG